MLLLLLLLLLLLMMLLLLLLLLLSSSSSPLLLLLSLLRRRAITFLLLWYRTHRPWMPSRRCRRSPDSVASPRRRCWTPQALLTVGNPHSEIVCAPRSVCRACVSKYVTAACHCGVSLRSRDRPAGSTQRVQYRRRLNRAGPRQAELHHATRRHRQGSTVVWIRCVRRRRHGRQPSKARIAGRLVAVCAAVVAGRRR